MLVTYGGGCSRFNRRYLGRVRAANITTFTAAILWFGLVLVGRDLEAGVARRMGGSVNVGQFDYCVLWPAYVVMTLLACAWGFNLLRRWYGFLGLVAGTALLAILPYLFFYGSGV
jgi:hypothetical protein